MQTVRFAVREGVNGVVRVERAWWSVDPVPLESVPVRAPDLFRGVFLRDALELLGEDCGDIGAWVGRVWVEDGVISVAAWRDPHVPFWRRALYRVCLLCPFRGRGMCSRLLAPGT